MRTTASYELFPDAQSERAMARARYLVREGRVADAEKAYRELLAEHPDLKPGWAECFELLRGQGRSEDALRLAEGARAQCGASAGRPQPRRAGARPGVRPRAPHGNAPAARTDSAGRRALPGGGSGVRGGRPGGRPRGAARRGGA